VLRALLFNLVFLTLGCGRCPHNALLFKPLIARNPLIDGLLNTILALGGHEIGELAVPTDHANRENRCVCMSAFVLEDRLGAGRPPSKPLILSAYYDPETKDIDSSETANGIPSQSPESAFRLARPPIVDLGGSYEIASNRRRAFFDPMKS
jgi:hypothetical protein